MEDKFKKELLLDIGVMALSLLILGGALFFVGKSVEKGGNDIREVRASIDNFANAGDRLASLKNSSLEAKEIEGKLDQLLQTEEQLLGFPDFIENIARENQVKLTFSFQPNSVMHPGEAPGSVTFTLQATGQLQNIRDFMEGVEKKTLRYWVGLDGLEVIKSGEEYVLNSHGKVFFR